MEKIWLKHYQQNVPCEINMEAYQSIVDLFEQSCSTYSQNIAYKNLGCHLSYQQLESTSRQFAAYLQHSGLKKGDRIAIMMPNILQYPIALFGILRAGLIVVNTNPLYTSDELVHQLNDSGAKGIIVLANFAHTLQQALSHTPAIEHVIVTEIGDCFPPVKKIAVNCVIKYIKRLIPSYQLPCACTFNHALRQGAQKFFKPVTLTQDDIAFLQYTGGTTGISKAATLTHGNMLANVLQATAWMKPLDITSNEIIITALPLYHVFSLTANCLTFLKVGATNILITNPRDMNHFIKEIKSSGFTAITGVNTLFQALLSHKRFKDIDFSNLKLALSGGMALQQQVAQKWQQITQARILEAYGLTETSPAVTINPFYVEQYNGSIGLPLPSTEIAIRDDDGHNLSIGEKGELCVKGPQVMRDYWQRPDETALVFWPDGFLRTGDIAIMDEKGFIYIVDRKKDMIVISGFNVYPSEVEKVIDMHPDVIESGVIGIKDEKLGERVKACIVARDPGLSADDIIKHCRKHLTAYKVPKIIAFHDTLPKTNVGKILRRELN